MTLPTITNLLLAGIYFGVLFFGTLIHSAIRDIIRELRKRQEKQ